MTDEERAEARAYLTYLSTIEARGETWVRRAVEYLRVHGAAFPERP
jgi:hypothetical protein